MNKAQARLLLHISPDVARSRLLLHNALPMSHTTCLTCSSEQASKRVELTSVVLCCAVPFPLLKNVLLGLAFAARGSFKLHKIPTMRAARRAQPNSPHPTPRRKLESRLRVDFDTRKRQHSSNTNRSFELKLKLRGRF